jgi:hypothetical protein
MKQFDPSHDFVARVMTAVHAEVRTCAVSVAESVFMKSTLLRWSLALAAAAMTLLNLFRMLACVLSPAYCG